MAVWGGLTNSCEKREMKSKGEKERYKHLNAEFQRIARRDKKGFFSDQCKEIEENNIMEKIRDLFKKIRDTIFHAKMGTIKDRNGMDITEGDGTPVELFQILKDDALKVLHSICQQIWKTQQWPQDWKRSVFIAVPKNAQTTAQLHSSHTLVK